MGDSFSRAVFLFKTKVLKPKINKRYQETETALQQEDLSDLNFKKRQQLLAHALTHSPFYKDKYAGLPIAKEGIRREEDFFEIPPLTRTELQANFKTIKADNVSFTQYHKASTSGSTGLPISVLHDRRHPATLIRWRIQSWWGVQPWENQAFVYRFKRSFSERLKNKTLLWPTKRIFLAAADLNSKKIDKFVRDFNRLKPTLLQGFVDIMFEFALYLLDNNIKIHPPKMVWVTSAPLFQEQRELMEKAFGAPVCDQYGNTEILVIAAECPEQKGLHLMHDAAHVEFVDENNRPVPPNTTGRILLTDLTNFAFPLIRYDIGDRGRYMEHSCSCGSPLPLMESIKGRQTVNIKTPTGLLIRGEHLMAMFDGYMKVFREIQLCQEADFSVRIDYVPRNDNQGAKEIEKMAELLKQRARSEIKVTFKEVHKIQRVNQKTPLIISRLK
ncbi:AMP-binding protein [uncultured Kriegella sp.]|uniref:phenylacetate--CoA ligase family protein n=1 Tax=uncultured Kriegella sp. TaxID=1798910 RepID=UPI0030DC0155|tara:strand:+ start:26580 stop:27908 length:1329 start_codon:yes stop_codon:yes gene_type:complete